MLILFSVIDNQLRHLMLIHEVFCCDLGKHCKYKEILRYILLHNNSIRKLFKSLHQRSPGYESDYVCNQVYHRDF